MNRTVLSNVLNRRLVCRVARTVHNPGISRRFVCRSGLPTFRASSRGNCRNGAISSRLPLVQTKCRVTSTIEPRNLHLRISKNRRFWVLSAGNGGDIRSEWVCYFFAGGEKVESPHKHAPPSVDAAHEYQNASLTFRLLHAHRASPRAHRRQTPRPRRHARRRLRQEVQRKALARRRH